MSMQRETRSACPYCGVGCGVIIESDVGGITGVRGDPDHPANFGRLCTKGSTLHLTMDPDARAWYPELRRTRDMEQLEQPHEPPHVVDRRQNRPPVLVVDFAEDRADAPQ